jgi:hypothetical protein
MVFLLELVAGVPILKAASTEIMVSVLTQSPMRVPTDSDEIRCGNVTQKHTSPFRL